MASVIPAELIDNTYWCSLIGLRREVHMHPEPGFSEKRTQSRVREILTKFAGIPEDRIRVSAITGLVADIHGTGAAKEGHAVKCVALRSDLDALTMTEGNNSLPYRSKNEGVAHMCGHDGHIAGLIGAAILLQKRADRIPSNFIVRLIFQPAEESTPPGTGGFDFSRTGGGGAVPMIDEGCLEGVDEIYGWHNWPTWPLGEIRVAPGPVMAHTSSFEIEIRGRGGHGSQPHACIDPIVCTSAVVAGLQTIVSRSVPSFANAVVTVGQFHSGERNNVIPDTAKLGGTIRDVDEKVFDIIKKRMHELVNSICKGYGCTAEIKIMSQYPALVNHTEQTEVVRRCAASFDGPLASKVTADSLPIMGGEDFAFYVKQRPGCFFFLGTQEFVVSGLASYEGGDDTPRSNCVCHGTTYDFNDNVLPRAVAMLVRIVEDRFGLELYSQKEILEGKSESNATQSGEKRPRLE
eukprot:TRINITY_DN49445_c0_g1_i1.p1 TRINITY_DN49445_c0_g1~~TRINITY_DN49445_c0_g1_i1.p1  ORF type:complete len:476 (+),score=78.27 TRINITY_DN49445_c0_g1_i1:41-1429(+)